MDYLSLLPTDIHNLLLDVYYCHDLLLVDRCWHNKVKSKLQDYHDPIKHRIDDIILSNSTVLTKIGLTRTRHIKMYPYNIFRISNKFILRLLYRYRIYIYLDVPNKWYDDLSNPKGMKYLVHQASKLRDIDLISQIVDAQGLYNVIQGLQRARDIDIQIWFIMKYSNQLITLKDRSPLSYRPAIIYENIIEPTSVTQLELLISIGYNFSDGSRSYPSWMLSKVRKDPIALRELLRWNRIWWSGSVDQIDISEHTGFSHECWEVIREERPEVYESALRTKLNRNWNKLI